MIKLVNLILEIKNYSNINSEVISNLYNRIKSDSRFSKQAIDIAIYYFNLVPKKKRAGINRKFPKWIDSLSKEQILKFYNDLKDLEKNNLDELLGGVFGKTKQLIKATKIGDDFTSIVFDVEFEGTDISLHSQKNYGEILKKKPNVFSIYIKNQDRRGKKIFEAKALAEKINKFLDEQNIPFSLDDTHDAWVFTVDKKYVNVLG